MKMATMIRFWSGDHHDVRRSPCDQVIAHRTLIWLRCLERLEHPNVEIGIGPRSDSGNQVRNLAAGIVVGKLHPRWRRPSERSFRSAFAHCSPCRSAEQCPSEQRDGRDQRHDNEHNIERPRLKLAIRIEAHRLILVAPLRCAERACVVDVSRPCVPCC